MFPWNRLVQTKKETHTIERHNAQMRHCVARFNRKTIAFSRCKEMVIATMKLLQHLVHSVDSVLEAWNIIPNIIK
ncbi:MAG: IS1 family transposase [Vampirovibrionales bacterium]